MDVSKKKRLASITDEVSELHPLLDMLFPKLQNVIDVEYTHGASEMGADFVISYRNEIFQNIEYIGVIAKVGKVLQDFSDIDRQIDECAIPRTFFGGKEKIRLDEIWVVVTQNISKGAQEKIHEKYSLRKIKFVDGSRLADLIDKYMPVFWSQVSLEVGEYLTSLHARNEEVDRALSLIQIGDEGFYIKQDIYEFPRLEHRIKMRKKRLKPRKVSIEDILGQQKLVLIEGGMGSGKSKLIRRIVERFTRPEVFIQAKTVPVPTTYCELQDRFGGDIQRLIEETVPEELRLKHDDVSFLVLVDGLDEKNVPMEEQIQALSSLAECVRTTTRTKAIVTSRYLAGLDNTYELEHEIARYELPPLSLRKTIEFLKALCTKLNLSNRLIEDLKKSQLFKELPQSPIAAILLAKLLNENPKDLPSNITELYAQYTELMLGRWEIDKGLQTMKEYQALDHLLMQMSKNLLDYEMPCMTIADARTMVNAYLQARNLEIDPDQLFDRMLKRCEIILADHDRNVLGFKHRTFSEFFYAKEMLRSGHFDLAERALHPYWMNTVFFCFGILKDCPQALEEIIALEPASEIERWLKILNIANYSLAAYASPYDIITKGTTEAMLDAAKLFKEIVSGETDSPFSCLPHMHLLYLLQFLMRESYSYEFFRCAIEDAALCIDDGPYPEDLKAYAVFFLNVAYIDLGAEESFDFLLKKHLRDLPLDLALAIHHEGKELKVRSALMRKQDRRLRKLLKDNEPLQAWKKAIYENPIRGPSKDPTKSH